MPVLNAAWATKVVRIRAFMTQAGPGHNPLSIPISIYGGWHPEAHRAILPIASGIACISSDGEVGRARSLLFLRHVALLATNNGSSLLSRCVANCLDYI